MSVRYKTVKDQFIINPQNDLLVREGFISATKPVEEHKEDQVSV